MLHNLIISELNHRPTVAGAGRALVKNYIQFANNKLLRMAHVRLVKAGKGITDFKTRISVQGCPVHPADTRTQDFAADTEPATIAAIVDFLLDEVNPPTNPATDSQRDHHS